MSALAGALRKKLFAPSYNDVTLRERGFPGSVSPQARQLERIPRSVILGFEFAIEHGDRPDTLIRLDMVEREFRGFAYEGAAMAFTLLDVLPGGRRDRTRNLLEGHAAPHLFLAYIGIGFAMARLPRRLWGKVLPDLRNTPWHPTVSWLAVDGYGFDRAYFDTRRWVGEQHVPPPYPWQGAPEYFRHACDQGVGRALWFIHGGLPDAVAAAVGDFAPARQADLWSGVGLAAAFAGAGDAAALKELRALAGEYRPELAQGAVFAAKGRDMAGLQTPHTDVATRVLCDVTICEAVEMTDRASSAIGAPASEAPAYERWRRAVQQEFR